MYQTPYHTGDLSSSSFLITGGAGFIGSNLVEYLIRFGAGRVRVLDNLSTGRIRNLEPFRDHPAFEFVEGDIRDPEVCVSACRGMDFVSHQAALGSVPRSVKDPLSTNNVNIDGYLNVLEAARTAGTVRKMVYASSSSVYGSSQTLPKIEDQTGDPLSPYAVTKCVNELYAGVYARVYGWYAVGLRYFNVFGPKQDPNGPYAAVMPLFMRAATEGKSPLINGDGEQSRDFTFVENAVQANVKALLNGGGLKNHEVFNIAFGASITLNTLWEKIQQLTGKTLPAIYGEPRPGDIRHSLADIGKARDLLGYAPRFDVPAGLEITWKTFKDER